MSAKTVLAMALKDEFVEFVEGDEDLQSILMDKLSVFMDEKAPFVDEDTRFDIALQILSNLTIR